MASKRINSTGRNLTHRDLALSIHELLDLPLKNGRPVIGYKIVKAIARSLRDAVKRGEEIRIPGFGIFRTVTWKPHRTGNPFLTQNLHSPVPIEGKPRKVVTFLPSEQLLAMLNRGTTWQEKRAMSNWDK